MVFKKITISLLFFIQLSVVNYQLSANDSSISNSQPSVLSSHQLSGNNYIDGEVIIKYKETATDSTKKALADKHSLKTIRTIKRFRLQHMKLPAGVNVIAFIQKLKKERHIEYAEPNYKRIPLVVSPNDPNWAQQWGMAKISMPDAWEINKGSPNVTVAVIDTGVDYTHPDLVANIWSNTAEISGNNMDDDGDTRIDDIRGWNFYCPENRETYSCPGNNDPMDTWGHGTNLAGVIGAVGNNGAGVAGVNWNVKIMPLRFMYSSGTVAAEVKAIDYAIQMGARVINASYGDDTFSFAEYEAIKHAADHGILFVAAAGNGGYNHIGDNNDNTERCTKLSEELSEEANKDVYILQPCYRNYPASYSIENVIDTVTYPPLSNIISVAALTSSDALTSYSNYGATSVHLGAPGSSIYSTALNGGYQSMSGTSLATPFVSGVAALLWSQRPGATYTQIKEAILQSVDAVPALSGKVVSGGRLNAFKALQKIDEFFAEVSLQAGWNFISFPKDPSPNNTIAEVLKEVSPNVRIVWGYDNQSKVWLKYSLKTQNSTLNTLDKVETGKGYWMYMNSPATLTISGQPATFSPQSVSLYNGWNLVGFSGADNAGIDEELAKLGNDWVIVWAWTDGDWYARNIGTVTLPVLPLSTLNQSRAYWIKMNSGSRKVEWVQ